jgi:hypothetical protein
MHPTNCLNCEADLHTGFKYCAKCGQKVDIHRLSFHEVGHDVLHYLTHADKGVLFLLGELALRPGKVAREFISGKRKKYFKPVSFFMIVAGILVFMTSYFHIADEALPKRIEMAAARESNPVKKQYLVGLADRMRNVDYYVSKYSNVINMLATPVFAFIFWLFYKRSYSFIEHLVANLYFVSFTMIVYALVLVPFQAKLDASRTTWIIMSIFFLFEWLYKTFAYYRFINKKGGGPFVKALGVSFLTVFIWVGSAFLLVQQYIMTGFK